MENMYMGVLVPASVLVPILTLLFRFKPAPKAIKIVFIYLVLATISNVTASVLANRGLSNLVVLHLFTLVEGTILLAYFREVLTNRYFKTAAAVMLVVYPVFNLLNFSFLQSFQEFNTYVRPFEALLLIAFCLLYITESLNRDDEEGSNWAVNPYNWINTGILLYFPSSFIIFTFANVLLIGTNQEMDLVIWNIHATLVLAMYLFFAMGFWKWQQ